MACVSMKVRSHKSPSLSNLAMVTESRRMPLRAPACMLTAFADQPGRCIAMPHKASSGTAQLAIRPLPCHVLML